jgi:hypothetical protein
LSLQAIVGSARQARIACEISFSQEIHSKGCSASEARQARGSSSSVGNCGTAQRLCPASCWVQRSCPARGIGMPYAGLVLRSEENDHLKIWS